MMKPEGKEIIVFDREVIQKERMRRNLTYSHMARLLGITPSGYIYKEHGHRSFTLAEIYKIAKYFNLPLEKLIKVVNIEEEGGEKDGQ